MEHHRLDLWPCLHDSILRRVETNAAKRSAVLAMQNLDLNELFGYGTEAQFEIHFEHVRSLIVLVLRHFPVDGTGDAAYTRRLQSASWDDFERAFDDRWIWTDEPAPERGRYQILSSSAAVREDVIDLQIDEIDDFAQFTDSNVDLLSEIRVSAQEVHVLFPDGSKKSVEDFVSAGTAFWETYRRKGP